jgi:hypothetical protein
MFNLFSNNKNPYEAYANAVKKAGKAELKSMMSYAKTDAQKRMIEKRQAILAGFKGA